MSPRVSRKNKSMLITLALLMSGIYLWVTKEDAVANQFSSCGRLGLSSAPPRTLILFPRTLLGSAAARALSRAGHQVFVLLDDGDAAQSDPPHAGQQHDEASHYALEEIGALRVRGSLRNVSALVELVLTHGIQGIVDTRPLREASPDAVEDDKSKARGGGETDSSSSGGGGEHMLAFARRLAFLHSRQGSGLKRSYVYTSGCTMHALSSDADLQGEAAPLSVSSVPEGGDPKDFPVHEPLSAVRFEEQLLALGQGRSAGLHTIILRPGVLYGGAAWASSPLRHWIHPPTATQQQKGREFDVTSVSGSASAAAMSGSPSPLLSAAAAALPSPLSSLPFQAVHLSDVVAALVAVGGATPASLTALSGGGYHLLDETKVSNGLVALALQRAAASTHEGAGEAGENDDPSAMVPAERNVAHFAHDEETGFVAPIEVRTMPDDATSATPLSASQRKLLRVTAAGSGSAAGLDDPHSSSSRSHHHAHHRAPRCSSPSKSTSDKFQTITRWKPAHRRFNEPDQLRTYVRAIRALEHQREHGN